MVCVCVFGRTQPALPAQGSAAKTIICDRSARDDSLQRDSLTPSDDQNRKKLTGEESESERARHKDTERERLTAFLSGKKPLKKRSERSIKVKDVKCVELSKP